MSYHPTSVHLSTMQMKKLASGGAIALKKSQMGGADGKSLHLTKSQMNRMQKGNGIRLRFSGAQLKHNLKHGGALSDAVDWLKRGAKTIARKGVGALADRAGDFVSAPIKNAVSVIPFVGKAAGKLAEKGIKKGFDALGSHVAEKVIGHGMKKPRAPRKKGGKGLFSSVGNVLDSGFNRVLGTGLYPPGYGGSLLPPPIKGVNSNAAGI